MNTEFSKSPGEIVSDANIVGIYQEIFEGDMEGEKCGGEEEAEEEGMRCHRRTIAGPADAHTRLSHPLAFSGKDTSYHHEGFPRPPPRAPRPRPLHPRHAHKSCKAGRRHHQARPEEL